MKLSEAIRLGCLSVTDNRSAYLQRREDDYCGCALGAAAFAIGMRQLQGREDDRELLTAFPLLSQPVTYHDITGTVAQVISSLHFTNEMTRLEIADWVATIEPQEVPVEVIEETCGGIVRH